MISADNLHEVANMMMGLKLPRWWVRGLSLNKREKLATWLHCFWADANDNYVPKKDLIRPSWVPKKYIWG